MSEPEPAQFVNCVVGQIVDCKNLEGSNQLYVCEVNIGNDETKHIVTNVRKFYSLDEMKDKRVCVYTNAEPTEIFGEISEGMLIGCGPDKDHVELVEPDLDEEIGALIYFGSATEDEVTEIDQRSKYWRKMLNDLKIDREGNALYKGENVYTDHGNITAPSFRNCGFQ